MVVLPDSFRGIGARRNSTKAQQSGHAPRSGPEVKTGRSNAKDSALERLYVIVSLASIFSLNWTKIFYRLMFKYCFRLTFSIKRVE